MPNADVPRDSDCEPLTVIEPASRGALLNAGVATETRVRLTSKLAPPFIRPKTFRLLTSPAIRARSPLMVRPEPVTPPQLMADALDPEAVLSWMTPFVTDPLRRDPPGVVARGYPSRTSQHFVPVEFSSAANWIVAI